MRVESWRHYGEDELQVHEEVEDGVVDVILVMDWNGLYFGYALHVELF